MAIQAATSLLDDIGHRFTLRIGKPFLFGATLAPLAPADLDRGAPDATDTALERARSSGCDPEFFDSGTGKGAGSGLAVCTGMGRGNGLAPCSSRLIATGGTDGRFNKSVEERGAAWSLFA